MIFRKYKILEVGSDYLIAAKGYRFYRLTRDGRQRHYMGSIRDSYFGIAARFRMLSRLLRAEVYFFKTLNNGQQLCIAKKGIFRLNGKTGHFEKCFPIVRGTRPMNFGEDERGTIYFGEYFNNPSREPVHIYKSDDSGHNWQIAYTFPEGSIRHIHGIHFDKYTNRMWIVTGDLQNECVIGYSDDQFRSMVEVFRGGQDVRACKLLFFEDEVVYGTDSETAQNYIKAFDRTGLKIRDIFEVQGSVINAVKIGNNCFFNTTVEPSQLNTDQNSYQWVYNLETGRYEVIKNYLKDRWDHRYFQFGQCLFPEYKAEHSDMLYFYGCALKGIDGHSVGLKLSDILP